MEVATSTSDEGSNVNRLLLIAALVAMISSGSAAEPPSLCPDRPSLPEGADDHRMPEAAFTVEKARESIHYLGTDFAKKLWGPDPVKDLSGWSGHAIVYANSLKLAEGAVLRTDALLQRALEREVSRRSPASAEHRRASQTAELAVQVFCEFIATAEYSD